MCVESSVKDGIGQIILSKPERRNAIDIKLAKQFAEGVRLIKHQGANVVVLSGVGPVFSSGIDLKCPDGAQAFDIVRDAIDEDGLFWIAQVQGPFIGGAVAYVAQCHLVIAAEDAWFSVPEVHHGLFPTGVLEGLKRKVSQTQILPILLSGEQYSAAHAKEIGLASIVVSQRKLPECAAAWATRFKGLSSAMQRQFLTEWASSKAASARED